MILTISVVRGKVHFVNGKVSIVDGGAVSLMASHRDSWIRCSCVPLHSGFYGFQEIGVTLKRWQ